MSILSQFAAMRLFFKAPIPLRTAHLRTHVDRRARFALGRFAETIHTATATLEDVNGPRGGVDKCCRVQLRIPGDSDIAVEAVHEDAFAATDIAFSKARRALARRRDRATEGRGAGRRAVSAAVASARSEFRLPEAGFPREEDI
jgi:ribosome-associated translation inhibitor RaiA